MTADTTPSTGTNWDIRDLQQWDERIREKVEEFGLDCYPQEFEVCDHEQMLGYMAYSGMPAHYPHWSYGKSFERQKTMYDHGVAGLPYEMVINSNPSIAYLMRRNSLCLQVLTIGHVYGHNDFFKNNYYFRRGTRAELVLAQFKSHADRVRGYIEDPSIGLERVEAILDAAHALSFNLERNPGVPRLSREQQEARLESRARGARDPYHRIHGRRDYEEPDTSRVPLEPDPDLLLFIRDYGRYLEEWERDLLTIVDEEARYFVPQIETKIMNEGWATFWHRAIMNNIDLPQSLYMEFLVRHNQVVRRIPGDINPYCVGLALWDAIVRAADGIPRGEPIPQGVPGPAAREIMFSVRESERDASFIRRFMTEELMRDLDLFSYEPRGEDLVVTAVADKERWKDVRDHMIRNTGMNAMPVIRVVDSDYGRAQALLMEHQHEGRDPADQLRGKDVAASPSPVAARRLSENGRRWRAGRARLWR